MIKKHELGYRLKPDHSALPTKLDELVKLTPQQLQEVDIATMNLLCSEKLPGDSEVDLQQAIRLIDRWADDASHAIPIWKKTVFEPNKDLFNNSLPLFLMYAIYTCLEKLHLVEYAQSEMDRSKPGNWRNAHLHMLFGLLHYEKPFKINIDRYTQPPAATTRRHKRREGTCASLPVLLVAVARRLSFPVHLAHSYGHIYCIWDGMQGTDTDQLPQSWKERHNIEITNGFDHHPDQWYYKFPKPWPGELHAAEARRKVKCYLRPLVASEELATFLVTRSAILESLDRYSEAFEALKIACELAPAFDYYPSMLFTCHQKWIRKTLEPWQITPQQLRDCLLKRESGIHLQLPWEKSPGVVKDQHLFKNEDDRNALRIFQANLRMEMKLRRNAQNKSFKSITTRPAQQSSIQISRW